MVKAKRKGDGFRSASGRYILWSHVVAEARKHPGAWVVRLVDQPQRLLYNVRHRAHPDLRLEDGVLEATIVNTYRSPMGAKRGDVYLRFTPNKQ